MSDSKWKSDYERFKSTKQIAPPQHLNERVLSFVRSELSPSPWKVFSKISFIHFIAAILTLSVCPQFGFRVFGEGMGLMHYFMSFGPVGCPIACGAFFMGTSLFVSTFLLNPQELRVLRSHRLTELGTLTMLSLGFFIMMDPSSIVLSFALAWLLGAIISGIAILEISCLLMSGVKHSKN